MKKGKGLIIIAAVVAVIVLFVVVKNLTAEKNYSKKYGVDLRVRETIKHILLDFWNNYDNVILFVCDSSDGRSAARMRLFNKWYYELNTDNSIIKIDFAVEEILASLLSKRDNCLLPFAEDELKQLFSLMQQ